MNNRRTNVQIMADILRLGPATKTETSYKLNIRRPQLDKYLDFLVKRGFLELSSGSKTVIYLPTQRGRELLNCIDRVTQVLKF